MPAVFRWFGVCVCYFHEAKTEPTRDIERLERAVTVLLYSFTSNVHM